jgi:hypothetical protein
MYGANVAQLRDILLRESGAAFAEMAEKGGHTNETKLPRINVFTNHRWIR